MFEGTGSWNPPAATDSNPLIRIYRNVLGLFGGDPGQTDYIKRVIGLPGDHVRCCNAQGLLTVNGVPLHESSYLYPGRAPSPAEQVQGAVGSGHLRPGRLSARRHTRPVDPPRAAQLPVLR